MELGRLSFHCVACMETCVLPNTQSVPVQAAVSVQEVQQIPKWGDLGVRLKRGAQCYTKAHLLPALGHRLKKGEGVRHPSNPLHFGSPSTTDGSEFSVVNSEFVVPSPPARL